MEENGSPVNRAFVLRVVGKAALIFLVLNLLYVWTSPLPTLGRISIYNHLVLGRERLPFGENPASYNLSLFQLDAMFASHEISQRKEDEFRIMVIGDSSVWGILLKPDETLAAQVTDLLMGDLSSSTQIHAYNLGYPTISVMKDLLILNRAIPFDPDLIIWMVTLEAMPIGKQVSSPIVQNNGAEVRALIDAYDVNIDPDDTHFVEPTLWDQTLIGQRRSLADLLRLNIFGVMWAATGIDQFYPESYELRQEDLEASEDFYGLRRPLKETDLAFDVVDAGIARAGDIPVLVVNEPMFISQGKNSDIRYNFYYPRWAYDDYRMLLADHANAQGWIYLDLWNTIPASEFSNSAIHLTPAGEHILAEQLVPSIRQMIAQSSN